MEKPNMFIILVRFFFLTGKQLFITATIHKTLKKDSKNEIIFPTK